MGASGIYFSHTFANLVIETFQGRLFSNYFFVRGFFFLYFFCAKNFETVRNSHLNKLNQKTSVLKGRDLRIVTDRLTTRESKLNYCFQPILSNSIKFYLTKLCNAYLHILVEKYSKVFRVRPVRVS